jgi:hypothetical protein
MKKFLRVFVGVLSLVVSSVSFGDWIIVSDDVGGVVYSSPNGGELSINEDGGGSLFVFGNPYAEATSVDDLQGWQDVIVGAESTDYSFLPVPSTFDMVALEPIIGWYYLLTDWFGAYEPGDPPPSEDPDTRGFQTIPGVSGGIQLVSLVDDDLSFSPWLLAVPIIMICVYTLGWFAALLIIGWLVRKTLAPAANSVRGLAMSFIGRGRR